MGSLKFSQKYRRIIYCITIPLLEWGSQNLLLGP